MAVIGPDGPYKMQKTLRKLFLIRPPSPPALEIVPRWPANGEHVFTDICTVCTANPGGCILQSRVQVRSPMHVLPCKSQGAHRVP